MSAAPEIALVSRGSVSSFLGQGQREGESEPTLPLEYAGRGAFRLGETSGLLIMHDQDYRYYLTSDIIEEKPDCGGLGTQKRAHLVLPFPVTSRAVFGVNLFMSRLLVLLGPNRTQ